MVKRFALPQKVFNHAVPSRCGTDALPAWREVLQRVVKVTLILETLKDDEDAL